MPFPSPGNLPDPGIEQGSLTSQADSLPFEPPGKPRFIQKLVNWCNKDKNPGLIDFRGFFFFFPTSTPLLSLCVCLIIALRLISRNVNHRFAH